MIRTLDFNRNTSIRLNLRRVKNYKPISFDQLKKENNE